MCVLDEQGEVIEEARVASMPKAFTQRFRAMPPARLVIEAGTHSPWVSRLLEEIGHEVIVANPRMLRFIYGNDSKNDRAGIPGSSRQAGPRFASSADSPQRGR